MTEEHIIPLSLGGTLELPEASCEKCQRETHAFEGHCAGEMFKAARTHFHWRSRKSRRPTTLRIGARLGGGGGTDIPVADHPPVVLLPTFQVPGILFGRAKQHGALTLTGVQICFGPGFRQRWEALGQKADVSNPFHHDKFARMLAKIAHSYAVAQLGIEWFTPFLPELILGKSKDFSNYVGSAVAFEDITAELHTLVLNILEGGMVVVYVRLYARYGGPAYMVAVGRHKP